MRIVELNNCSTSQSSAIIQAYKVPHPIQIGDEVSSSQRQEWSGQRLNSPMQTSSLL